MLKVEDFRGYDQSWDLCWKRFDKDGLHYEVSLSFCFEPIKDDAWYQIMVGQCFENDYKEIENHHFNSLKKAVKWWNDYFGDDINGELHFSV